MYVKLFYFLLYKGVVHKVSTFYIKLRSILSERSSFVNGPKSVALSAV